jgi:nucleotide-binding universal stress UspA family protein
MYQRILVPLDGSKTAEKVLPYVISEAKLHGATIVIIRIIAPLRRSLLFGIPDLVEDLNAHLTCVAEEYLEDISGRLANESVAIETELDYGPPALRILEFAKRNEIDLIIVGSHGETNAVRWRFGSVSNYIVRSKSPIPILLITT